MTVKEVVEILAQCDEDRTIYIQDLDGTAQPVAAVVDMRHVNQDMPGIKITDDIAMMTSRMMEEFENIEEDNNE